MGPDGGDLAGITEVMHVLSDLTRLRLLMVLSEGERNVSALVERTGYEQPTVSHHLGILRRGRVVVARRSGKEVFYRLADPSAAPAGTLCVAAGAGATVRVAPMVAPQGGNPGQPGAGQ